MNYPMVKRLILKDWYLQRWAIAGSIVGGVVTLGVIVTGGKAGFLFGVIGLVTVLIAVGAQVAMATTVLERKEQTLPFVMSLPVSCREYTAAKILAILSIFLLPWLTLVLGSFAILTISPESPRGLIPFVAIMATEILVSTCLVVAVAVTSESQGWTIGAIMVGNLTLNVVGYYVAHIPSIARGMFGHTVQWSSAASVLLLAEFAMAVLLLGLTFFFQARRTDFL
jgi:hypothetical protein